MSVERIVPELDLKKTADSLARELSSEMKKRRAEKAVLGLSGGVDSAVVLKLLSLAVDRDRIHPVFMPYKTTDSSSGKDAKLMAEITGLVLEEKDITSQIDAYFKKELGADKTRFGNKCARERMSVLYDISMREKGIVIGTSNRSEIIMGYGTVFGDLACAVNPLGSLFKSQIFDLAVYLSVPECIVSKKPSADLWKGQTDENDLGLCYKTIDEISYLYFDRKKNVKEIIRLGYRKKDIEKIISAFERNSFKREMPRIIKL
ncbi:MAG: NAD+ synthase [bacterium]|nr:NAD+ synthase [bacterium]